MFRPKSSISVYIVEHVDNDDDVDNSHKVVKCFADTREVSFFDFFLTL